MRKSKREVAYRLLLENARKLPDDPEISTSLRCGLRPRCSPGAGITMRHRDLSSCIAPLSSFAAAQARRTLDQALAAGLHDPLASDARRTLNTLDRTN